MIKVKGIDYIYAVWRSNKKPHRDISIEDKLLLFDISEFISTEINTAKQITF